jgi:16S rRNA (cytosine1402-N4)-methyltransferase
VKHYIKRGRWDEAGEYEEKVLPLLRPVNAKPIEPTPQEIKNNPRAGSAKLRIGERI